MLCFVLCIFTKNILLPGFSSIWAFEILQFCAHNSTLVTSLFSWAMVISKQAVESASVQTYIRAFTA